MTLVRLAYDGLGRALRDDTAAAVAALGTQVDDPIRLGHDVEIVFDHDDGVASIDQTMQDAHEFLDICHVQADRRLIEHIQGVLALAARLIDAKGIGPHLGEFGDQLDSLAFSAGKRRTGLTQTEVAESHVGEQAHRVVYAALGCEELERIVDTHGKGLADALALEQDAQGLGVEAFAAADVAENLDIGQEAHLDALHSLTLAGLAAAAGRIEGKSAGREPPNARFGGIRV